MRPLACERERMALLKLVSDELGTLAGSHAIPCMGFLGDQGFFLVIETGLKFVNLR